MNVLISIRTKPSQWLRAVIKTGVLLAITLYFPYPIASPHGCFKCHFHYGILCATPPLCSPSKHSPTTLPPSLHLYHLHPHLHWRKRKDTFPRSPPRRPRPDDDATRLAPRAEPACSAVMFPRAAGFRPSARRRLLGRRGGSADRPFPPSAELVAAVV